MNFFDNTLFNNFLYKPLFNALILLYQYLPGQDFGIAVIVLTIIIRVLLHPLMLNSLKSQKTLARIQPEIQEIQKKHKHDQQKQAESLMALYQREKINPFSGLVSLFIQLPILIALYRVFWKGFQLQEMPALYSFVPNPGVIEASFLGLINLSQSNTILAGLAAAVQFFQMKALTPKNPNTGKDKQKNYFLAAFQKQTIFFVPLITFFFLLKLPAAIGLYWITTSLFSIFQQNLLNNHAKTK
jgi:YidC/Oxa1 family membrane protein insertase